MYFLVTYFICFIHYYIYCLFDSSVGALKTYFLFDIFIPVLIDFFIMFINITYCCLKLLGTFIFVYFLYFILIFLLAFMIFLFAGAFWMIAFITGFLSLL